jgi:thiol-disulfide isomerase/thioredoxin
MQRTALLAIACCVGQTCAIPAQVTPSTGAADREPRLRTIRADFKAAILSGVTEVANAPESQKGKLRDTLFGRTLPAHVRKALDLIDENPTDDVAWAVLVWVMEQQAAWNIVAQDQHPKLFEIIEKHHLGRAGLGAVIYWLSWLQLDKDEKIDNDLKRRFVSRLMEESKHKSVRGLACFTLAEWSYRDYERATQAPVLDPAVVAETARRAELLFERVEKEFADIPFEPQKVRAELDSFLRKVKEARTGNPVPELKEPIPMTLHQKAAGYLIEIRQLAVGQRSPDLAGADLADVKLSLSDHKGKVVVVVFWASWCGPCMARVPNEIELVKRQKGKPFAFIGVNGDEDREAAIKAERQTGMNWPSIWAGASEVSPIFKAWGVRAWPTVYVIDHARVIRGKNLHGRELDRLVDTLVAGAEKAATTPK